MRRISRTPVGTKIGGALAVLSVLIAAPPTAADEWELFFDTSFILDVSVDEEGAWAATPGGLLRVSADGASIDLLTTLDGIISNRLRSVEHGPDGDLWLGTMGMGACRRRAEDDDWWIYGGASGLFSEEVIVIHPAADGVWIGTDGGVAKFLGEEREAEGPLRFNENLGLLADSVTAVQEYDGSLWFGTSRGLSERNPASGWVDHLSGVQINALAEDVRGGLWAATEQGAARWDGSRWEWLNAGLPATSVRDLLLVGATLWAATGPDGGVARWGDGSWVAENDGLVGEGIDERWYSARALGRHLEGGFWVGTEAGLAKRVDGAWVRFPVGGPVSNYVISIDEDAQGGLWFASGGDANLFRYGVEPWAGARGLCRLYQEEWTTYDRSDSGLTSDIAYRVLGDGAGNIWMGAWDFPFGGVFRKKIGPDSIWRRYTGDDGPGSNIVADLAPGPNGEIWVAAYLSGLGVYLPADSTWVPYLPGSGLPSPEAYSLPRAVAVAGDRVWVGTYGVEVSGLGIALINTRGTPADKADDLIINYPSGQFWPGVEGTVNDLFVEPEGTLWAGTGAGVASFNGSTWETYSTSADGTPLGEVRAVAVDADGNRWFATRQGIVRLSSDGGSWQWYDTGNSYLPWDDCTALHVESATGDLWIGTWGGGVARLRATGGGGTAVDSEHLVVGPNPFRPGEGESLIFPGLGIEDVVRIYTLSGHLVRELGVGKEKEWDGRDADGSSVASGIYLVVGEDERGALRRTTVAVIR